MKDVGKNEITPPKRRSREAPLAHFREEGSTIREFGSLSDDPSETPAPTVFIGKEGSTRPEEREVWKAFDTFKRSLPPVDVEAGLQDLKSRIVRAGKQSRPGLP